MHDSPIDLLLALLDRAYDKKSWHGPNLRGSIRRVDVATAAARPAPRRHNIWEIVVHCAYWKYAARRRLLGEKRGSFPLKGSNWFARPDKPTTSAAWAADVAMLNEAHQALRTAVAALSPAVLAVVPRGGKVSNWDVLAGIAAHDVYHAGQIQLLKRLV